MSLLDERSLVLGLLLGLLVGHALSLVFSLKLLYLLAVVLVKGYVIVANQVVALLAACLGCLAVAPLQPCQHGLADVYAAVVYYVGLYNAVAVGLHNLRKAPAEQVVAHVSQVERLVGVGRRVFDHHQRRVFSGLLLAEVLVGVDVGQQRQPCLGRHYEVKEALNHIERCHARLVVHQVLAYLLGRFLRLLVRHLQQREHDKCKMSLELFFGLLQLHHLCRHFLTVQLLDCLEHGVVYFACYIHFLIRFLFVILGAKLLIKSDKQKNVAKLLKDRRFHIKQRQEYGSGSNKK